MCQGLWGDVERNLTIRRGSGFSHALPSHGMKKRAANLCARMWPPPLRNVSTWTVMYRPFNGVPRADHFCLTCLSCLCMCVYLFMCLPSCCPSQPALSNQQPLSEGCRAHQSLQQNPCQLQQRAKRDCVHTPTPSSSSTPPHTHPNTSSGTLKGSPIAAAKSLSTVEGAEVDLSMKSVGLPAASPQ